MRKRSVAASVGVAVLVVVIGSATLISKTHESITAGDKAYYADPATVSFVRPGLVLKIVSADIAADGTIKVRFKLSDPKGLPLDREGIATPGVIAPSFVAASIPKGKTQYVSYTTRVQTSPITKVSAVQASTESNGKFEKVADGEYIYTFNTKAPSGFDRGATHTIGAQASRNLTEFDMGTNFDDDTYTFVPDGSKVSVTRDVVKTATCNKCHDELAFHGGGRRSMEMCVLCHTPQSTDPDTGNTVDLPVMVHKIHAGNELPSVKAGGKYSIVGFNQNEADYSTVGFPAYGGPEGIHAANCTACHESGKGAAQENAWLKPNRAACGACHDNVNFATGEGHVNLPQSSDSQCGTCHQPQGELEFDASVKGAHTIPSISSTRPGINLAILKVENATAGSKPVVTFTVRDDSGAGIPLSSLRTTPNRLALVMAGPTSDYGYTSFGSDVTTAGYVSEDPTGSAQCSNDGTCTYTFQHAIPADAKGTFAIGMEGRRGLTILPGTKKEASTEYGAINKVTYFSVDGTPAAPRRQVVDINKCNQCHGFLSLHGENRNQIEQCVLCHNAGETDKARRPAAQVAADKTMPPQSIDFALMIHKIHTGEHMKAMGREYTVVGFGGSHNDFTEVRYPAFSPAGEVGDLRNCQMCHVNGSEQLPLTGPRVPVTDPQGLVNPAGCITAACTGCHQSAAAASHALANTTGLGESCEVCHGSNADASVSRAHAQ